jgi:hypothetical protein
MNPAHQRNQGCPRDHLRVNPNTALWNRNLEQGHRVGRLGGGQDVVHRRCRLPIGPQLCLERASNMPQAKEKRGLQRPLTDHCQKRGAPP